MLKLRLQIRFTRCIFRTIIMANERMIGMHQTQMSLVISFIVKLVEYTAIFIFTLIPWRAPMYGFIRFAFKCDIHASLNKNTFTPWAIDRFRKN